MAGGGVDELALVGVVDRVDAGGDLAGVDLGGEAVEQLEHFVRGQVEPGVGADGGAELSHDGGGAHTAAHHVSDDECGASRAEGDDVVPVAADRRVRAAGLVRGGDPQVVGLLQLLREQGALEGDGGLAVPALAGAQPLGGFGVVGDVGGVHEDGAAVEARGVHGQAGDGVRAAVLGLAGLDRPGLPAAQDLVHQRQQAQLVGLGADVGDGGPGGAGSEGGGVRVVHVGDAVLGAVHERDEAGESADDLPYGEVLQGGDLVGEEGLRLLLVLPAGRGHGALGPPRRRAALRAGESGAPTGEVHGSVCLVVSLAVLSHSVQV